MSTLLLSLLLVVLIAVGMFMSKPIREHFDDVTPDMTDAEWNEIPEATKKMMLTSCHFEAEAPPSHIREDVARDCKYIKKNFTLKQEFDGYKKETIDGMQPWCDYLKANYAPVAPASATATTSTPASATTSTPASATATATPSTPSNPLAATSVSTLSEMLKAKQPINEELTQLQLNLERKCRQMKNTTDDTITPQNQAYWSDVCTSLGKVKAINARQMDVAAQQPYDEEVPRKYRTKSSNKCKENEESEESNENEECVDMSQYIKMDEVPCWNCSLP